MISGCRNMGTLSPSCFSRTGVPPSKIAKSPTPSGLRRPYIEPPIPGHHQKTITAPAAAPFPPLPPLYFPAQRQSLAQGLATVPHIKVPLRITQASVARPAASDSGSDDGVREEGPVSSGEDEDFPDTISPLVTSKPVSITISPS